MRDLPDDDHWLTDRFRFMGQRLRAERLRQNLTQDQVWLAAGVDRRTLQYVEAGQEPKLGTLLRIAYVLEVSLAELEG